MRGVTKSVCRAKGLGLHAVFVFRAKGSGGKGSMHAVFVFRAKWLAALLQGKSCNWVTPRRQQAQANLCLLVPLECKWSG